jgi:hypothetical protein
LATLLHSSTFISRKADGTPNSLGRVYTYAAGTLTPLASYTTQAGNVAQTNPVILGADGTAQVWLNPTLAYRIIEKTAADVLIRDTDNIISELGDLASTASGKGASLVGVQDAGGYFTGSTVEAALQEAGAGMVKAPWHFTKDSPVLMSLRHATSGNIVQQWQDGSPGTATYFYRGLSVQTNSHAMQMGPATNGGSVDLLFQRSVLNADPAGNRFNITFDEAADRLLFSYATTASGAPTFDTWMVPVAGVTPSLTFPAVMPMFNQGWGVKQRTAGGFELRMEQTSSTVATLKQIGGSATTFLHLRDGAMGFFGSVGTSRPTITGSRGGNAALASLLTNLATLGLITDGTSA